MGKIKQLIKLLFGKKYAGSKCFLLKISEKEKAEIMDILNKLK